MDLDFHPPPPAEPYFDGVRGAWILSRSPDVAAALRETALFQASSKGEVFPTGEDETSRSQMFAQVRAEIARIGAGALRAQMQAGANALMRTAAGMERVDLLGEIARPWCVGLLMHLGAGAPSSARRVSDISAALLYKNRSRSSSEATTGSAHALSRRLERISGGDPEKRLDNFLERKELSVSKSMFMAVSTTLPAFLAKSWLALLRNPAQVSRLLDEPQWMPNAIEELLRYAGIVHTLYRKAIRDVQISGVHVGQGQMVLLRVASANFDPERVEDPRRLDITRKPSGQFTLGAGLHACVGAVLVREAFSALTPVLFATQPKLEPAQNIVWMGDSTLKWPLAVFARLNPSRAGPEG